MPRAYPVFAGRSAFLLKTKCCRSAGTIETQRRMMSRLELAFVLLVLLGANGCGLFKRIPKPPTQGEIDRVLPSEVCPPPSVCTDNSGTVYSSVDIYIDDSGSMRGFVAREQTNYLRVLRATLLAATEAHFEMNVFPLSSKLPVSPEPLSKFGEASFYEKPDTPLTDLIRRIASQPDHAAIVVSDLVQSEKGKDTQGLIAVLKQLVEKRSEIRLLGFRSDFVGNYYPESHLGPNSKISVDVSQSVPHAGRPFYLLVIAPNRGTLQKLSSYVLNRLYPVNSFDPTRAAFEIREISLTPGPSKKPHWARYSRFLIRNEEKRMFESAYAVAQTDPQSQTIDLPITALMSLYAPLRSLEATEVHGRMASWNQIPTEPIPVDIPITGQWGADSKTAKLWLKLRRPAPDSWDVYRVSMRPGQGNLDVPSWVKEWSTEDDSSIDAANKTYRLQSLVQTMENAISEHRVCGEWTLKVNGGK